ncbi:MAG: hypothetical protein JKY52_01830 [Flavobacteriales bacterium]|nr:hypothetical protein [Flavobacteriales bacterium]
MNQCRAVFDTWLRFFSRRRCGEPLVGMVEWWNDGMMEWWNGGMVEFRNGGMVEWWNDGMME